MRTFDPQLRPPDCGSGVSECRIRLGDHELNQICVRELVVAHIGRRRIGSQFTGTKKRTLVDAYMVFHEKLHVSGYRQMSDGLAPFNTLELVLPYVVMLIESKVSVVHNQSTTCS